MSEIKMPIFRRIANNIINKTAPMWSDRLFLQVKGRIKLEYKLNLDNPRSFNEKINWLKLNHKDESLTRLVDKYAVKEYVASIIGVEHVIPTLAVYDKAEDIDFDKLPQQFVLKCTHDSGGIVVCKDKNKLDKTKAVKMLHKALKRNFIALTREYPYKNVTPRIIAEQYMEDEYGELRDYKVFCSDGKPWMMFIASNRQTGLANFDFYDMEFNKLPIVNGHPNAPFHIDKPKSFDKMIELASKLSKGFIHVRVDFYDINGHLYFGELTFFHNSGLESIQPVEWDYKMGEYIHLPQ